jgi:hypothetical protein
MDRSRDSVGPREERFAFNESLCRQLNVRKAQWIEDGLATAGFRCECVELHCGSRLRLSPEHWEEARSRSERFVVAPGHVDSDVEVVVERHPDFWFVEKRGKAKEIAEDTA